MSEKTEYPKWMYHKTDPPVIVNDPAEEDALGKGWHDKFQGADTAPAAVTAETPIDLSEIAPPKKAKKKE